MIRSIRHKGLRRLYQHDEVRGIRPEHAERLRDILARLDVATKVEDMDVPAFHLHALKGRPQRLVGGDGQSELAGNFFALKTEPLSISITLITTKRKLQLCR